MPRVSDARACRAFPAFEHHHVEAATPSFKCVSETDDACADDAYIGLDCSGEAGQGVRAKGQ
jgi:hypothetical protein